jgi:hypothetical protein
LNLAVPKEEDSLSDAEVAESQDVFQPLLDVLNYGSWIFAGFKFFWFTYPTGKTIFGPDGSGALLKHKINEWAGKNEPSLLERPLVIVAHSMGGLVARDFMQNHGGNVFRLVTICTPHYGSPAANLGRVGLGRFADYTSQGPKDLACDEEIKYKDFRGTHTASVENGDLRALNNGFPEEDPRLICYGATSKGHPANGPVDPFDRVMLETLSMVTGPEWLMETTDEFRSDGTVPWRSQYYEREGEFPDPDFKRTSREYYHRTIFNDFDILVSLYRDLVHIGDEYRESVRNP